MPVTILDTDITLAEVCLLQGHNINSLADGNSVRIYSDDMLSTWINNVIRFVRGNSRSDVEENIRINAINTLSVIEMNNKMHEDGYLPNWVPEDAFNKERFILMIEEFKESDDECDVIPLYRGQFHEVI